ncbi:MAG: C39 family peptidase [Leptolyngbya sp. BL-A-14]
MRLKVVQSTVFKQSAGDSAKLAAKDKVAVAAEKVFELSSWKFVENDHLKVAILGAFLGDPPRNTWFVYGYHVQLIDSKGKVVYSKPMPPPTPPPGSLPASKNLNVPYKSQLDNALNPTGACNVTSFSMVMAYFQIKQRTSAAQFEDELYRYMDASGLSRHEPEDLAKMAKAYGVQDNLTLRGSLADIRKAIAEGRPCIVHGYFTSFGHIVVIRGYNQSGFYVNDPYGEWTASGYLTDRSGQNLFYSNSLIQSKCSPEGSDYIWLHRLSKI